MKLPKITAHIAIICFSAFGLTTFASEQIELQNPGFENAFVGWKPFADNGKSQVIQEAAHTGSFGLRIVDESSEEGAMIESAKFDCVPGSTFEAKCWARVISGNGAGIYLRFYDEGKHDVRPASGEAITPIPADTKDWTEFSVKSVVPAGASKVLIWIHTGITPKITVDFDDFSLTRSE